MIGDGAESKWKEEKKVKHIYCEGHMHAQAEAATLQAVVLMRLTT